jgi:hypothetical protein
MHCVDLAGRTVHCGALAGLTVHCGAFAGRTIQLYMVLVIPSPLLLDLMEVIAKLQ